MKRLILYELKRILRSKVTISAMLSGVLVTTCSLLFELRRIDLRPKDERIEYGVITNEKVREDLHDLRKQYPVPEPVSEKEREPSLTKDIDRSDDLSRENYFNWIKENYSGVRFRKNEFEQLPSGDKYMEDFYKVREERAIAEIKYDRSMNYNSGEMNYLTGLIQKSSGPYRYGEADGYTSAFIFVTALPAILLAIGLSVGSAYSSDYETGAAEIVTASIHGKTHLSMAKIASALIFASVSILLISAAFLAILFGKYSFYGGDLPIQTLSTGILFPFTLKELLIRNMAAVFSATLITALASVFLSRLTKRTYVVYTVLLFAYLACRYISGLWFGGNTVFGKLMELSPFHAGSYQYLTVRVYSLFGSYYNYYEVYPVFYAAGMTALIIITVLLSKRALIPVHQTFTVTNIWRKIKDSL